VLHSFSENNIGHLAAMAMIAASVIPHVQAVDWNMNSMCLGRTVAEDKHFISG
jgi:hypothetical protein